MTSTQHITVYCGRSVAIAAGPLSVWSVSRWLAACVYQALWRHPIHVDRRLQNTRPSAVPCHMFFFSTGNKVYSLTCGTHLNYFSSKLSRLLGTISSTAYYWVSLGYRTHFEYILSTMCCCAVRTQSEFITLNIGAVRWVFFLLTLYVLSLQRCKKLLLT